METGLVALATKALDLTSNISALIPRNKEKRAIDKAKLEWTIDQTKVMLAEARAHNAADLACVHLDELVRTQERIDKYVNEGKLHGPALDMAYRRLDALNELLRKDFEKYTNY